MRVVDQSVESRKHTHSFDAKLDEVNMNDNLSLMALQTYHSEYLVQESDKKKILPIRPSIMTATFVTLE